ncbi:ABC transporter substrate-binding protein [Psychromarinibacter sp. C21-152]|uniref:ABC transporter substrate-binding protein n=1 Tax=Psychromarinibacter sediminicola TaxID=3033385 RepID=A0AAE3NX03_9RHOB|nr:ABC transporter substrate-binding protein [Psychromarinibacter sediminicola]MDF0603784.1 ABC transporter substrate-binding protein [Psychromarinibacter sediminicola]
MSLFWRTLRPLTYVGAAVGVMAGPLAAQEYHQAPVLDALVDAGELPPVEERLPDSPEVIEPLESIGTYGGKLRRVLGGSNDHNSILRFVGPQGLTRWAPDFSEVVPNVAESWETNEEGNEFTFHLREGMKWSDGEPFTADDIMFFVNDLLHNEEFYPNPPARFVVDGEAMTAEKVDDYTVTLKFAAPYGTFLTELATPLAQEPVLWAKHYCQQYHPAYNENVQEMVEETEAVEDWPALFRLKCGEVEAPNRWANAERPVLDPWVVTGDGYSAGATQVVMTRNPYFWQVDTEGNQLPYIDTLEMNVAQDNETLVLEAIAGNIDMQRRRISGLGNKPVFAENADKANIDILDMVNSNSNTMAIHFNHTHKDPMMRDVLRNKDVRIALSLGIDREEIIDIVYQGQGEPWQIGPRPSHKLYNEQLGRQYTEYDPDRANELLDEAGFAERDSEGYRLLPNGERFVFDVQYTGIEQPDWGDALEIIAEQWEELGIELNISSVERSIYYSRGEANEHDFMVWGAPGGLDPTLSPRDVLAVHPQASWFAIPWARWYLSGGEQGEEPTESMKTRLALYDEFKQEPDQEAAMAIFRRIHQMAADEFEIIGVSLAPNLVGVVKRNLMNVPDQIPSSWMYPDPFPTLPVTYYWAEE